MVLITPTVYSKCAFESHDVTGELSLGSRPFSGASVKVRALGAAKELIESSGIVEENGFYSVTLKYNTYSGPGVLVADKCDFLLKEAVILVSAKNFKAFSEKLTLSDGITTYNKAFKLMDAANRSAH